MHRSKGHEEVAFGGMPSLFRACPEGDGISQMVQQSFEHCVSRLRGEPTARVCPGRKDLVRRRQNTRERARGGRPVLILMPWRSRAGANGEGPRPTRHGQPRGEGRPKRLSSQRRRASLSVVEHGGLERVGTLAEVSRHSHIGSLISVWGGRLRHPERQARRLERVDPRSIARQYRSRYKYNSIVRQKLINLRNH